MATEKIIYLNYAEAVLIHLRLMQTLGETRYGVDFRELIDSALSRPKHSAIYENADIIRQMPNLEREDLQAVLQYVFASS